LAEDNHGSLYAGASNFYAHSIDEDGILSMTKSRFTQAVLPFMQGALKDELIKDRKKSHDATKAEMAKQR
jgi:hypothetical protein